MTRMWDLKKQSLLADLQRCEQKSLVLAVIGVKDYGPEIRAIVQYSCTTLVKNQAGVIMLAGPVAVGIRYRDRYLSEAPHPLEIATILSPLGIFHPNCSPTGFLCQGHPMPGLSMDQIVHQVWAAVTFNMHMLNMRPGEVLNREAADYVRANPKRFPLSDKGLFEAMPTDQEPNTW